MKMRVGNMTRLFLVMILAATGAEANIRAAGAEPKGLSPEYGLLLTRTGQSADRSGRGFSHFQFDDPVRAKLVEGTLSQFRPAEGDTVGDDNRLAWKRVEFNDSGAVGDRLTWKRVEFDDSGAVKERGLYLYAPVESKRRRVAVVDSASHGEMYVNGRPRTANVYSRNYFHVPVLLNKRTA